MHCSCRALCTQASRVGRSDKGGRNRHANTQRYRQSFRSRPRLSRRKWAESAFSCRRSRPRYPAASRSRVAKLASSAHPGPPASPAIGSITRHGRHSQRFSAARKRQRAGFSALARTSNVVHVSLCRMAVCNYPAGRSSSGLLLSRYPAQWSNGQRVLLCRGCLAETICLEQKCQKMILSPVIGERARPVLPVTAWKLPAPVTSFW